MLIAVPWSELIEVARVAGALDERLGSWVPFGLHSGGFTGWNDQLLFALLSGDCFEVILEFYLPLPIKLVQALLRARIRLTIRHHVDNVHFLKISLTAIPWPIVGHNHHALVLRTLDSSIAFGGSPFGIILSNFLVFVSFFLVRLNIQARFSLSLL